MTDLNLNLNFIYSRIYDLLSGKYVPEGTSMLDRLFQFILFIKPFSIVISLLFLTGIVYCMVRMRSLSHEMLGHGGHDAHGGHGDGHDHEGHEEHGHSHVSDVGSHGHTSESSHGHSGENHGDETHHHSDHAEPASHSTPEPSEVDLRWERIVKQVNSVNPAEWRLAIIECDVILEEMLTKMSYHGATVGDKLKAVERSDFLTLDKAWEAHNVRNAIAHEGSSFKITDREARRIVGLYQDVFKEFHLI